MVPASLIFLGFIFGLWKVLYSGRREAGLPPGPATVFFFGNALQMPMEFLHLKLSEWAKQFGEVFSIKVLSKTVIVISGPEAVREILEKNGSLTGGRPSGHITDITTEGLYLPLQPDMSKRLWKLGRRYIQASISNESLATYYLPLHEEESIVFLKDVLDSPKDVYTHLKRMSVSIVQHHVYGKPCLKYKGDTPEKFFEGANAFNECFDIASQPPVDILPFLKWIPERWAAWKTKCRVTLKMRNDLWESLLSESEQLMKEEKAKGCFLERLFELNRGLETMNRDEIRAFGGMMLDTGAETSSSSLQTLLLALINNPECQEKARRELDEFIPSERLPLLDDFDNLAYLQAFIKEVNRYRPLFPLAIPHCATGDIMYKGYCIPKGTTIFMNTWHLLHDPNLYEDPESFYPERYLESEFGTKPGVETKYLRNNYVFGAGRRMCPGQPLATRIIALNMMRWLWAFEFSRDSSGTGHMDMDAFVRGIEMSPLPFTCNVTPRKGREDVIRRLYTESGNGL